MALVDSPEKAASLARAYASDIIAYNAEKLVEGIEKDAVFELLAGEIGEALQAYRGRLAPELYASSNFFNRALVDAITSFVRKRGGIPSKIW
jgi:hypothetical protein